MNTQRDKKHSHVSCTRRADSVSEIGGCLIAAPSVEDLEGLCPLPALSGGNGLGSLVERSWLALDLCVGEAIGGEKEETAPGLGGPG
jgi:hypothetical protein